MIYMYMYLSGLVHKNLEGKVTAMADLQERSLTISGVKVIFPCKPYPSQFGMMDRVSWFMILISKYSNSHG